MTDSTSYIASKYKYLFRVPGGAHAVILVFLLGIISGALIYLGGVRRPEAVLYTVGALSLTPLLLNPLLKLTLLRSNRIVTHRRLSHMTLLEGYMILAALLIGSLVSIVLGSSTPIVAATYASFSCSAYIRTTVMGAFNPYSRRREIAVGLAEPLAKSTVFGLLLGSPFSGLLSAASAMLGSGLGILVLLNFLRPIRNGAEPLKLAAGVVAGLLVGDNKPLEEMLTGLSSTYTGASDVFIIKPKTGMGDKPLVVVIPPFHTGPMRSIGSTMLPYIIERALRERGYESLVLKSCSKHDCNIASREFCERVSNEIVDSITASEDGYVGGVSLMPTKRVGKVSITGLRLGGRTLLIPTLHPAPMEDLPNILAQVGDEEGATIVDPHNSYEDGFKGISAEDVAAITEAIRWSAPRIGEKDGELGFAFRRYVPPGYGLSDGIGPSGFSLLGISSGEHRIALAVVDGNNSTPDVREEVAERLVGKGWDAVELLTTDTHIVNGIAMGGKGYSVIGERIKSGEVAEIFARLSEGVSGSLQPAEARYIRVEHRDVKVFSDRLLEELAGSARTSLYLYLLGALVSAFLPLLMA